MLELNELMQLLDKVNESGYDEFELEHGSLKLKLKKSGNTQLAKTKEINPIPVFFSNEDKVPSSNNEVNEIKTIEPIKTEVQVQKENYKIVTSPMVGTFYSRQSPDSPDYVKVGDKVSKNSTVCIVEAMKLFNEIQAENDGEIVEVLVQNGQLVEYGQPLFYVR